MFVDMFYSHDKQEGMYVHVLKWCKVNSPRPQTWWTVQVYSTLGSQSKPPEVGGILPKVGRNPLHFYYFPILMMIRENEVMVLTLNVIH